MESVLEFEFSSVVLNAAVASRLRRNSLGRQFFWLTTCQLMIVWCTERISHIVETSPCQFLMKHYVWFTASNKMNSGSLVEDLKKQGAATRQAFLRFYLSPKLFWLVLQCTMLIANKEISIEAYSRVKLALRLAPWLKGSITSLALKLILTDDFTYLSYNRGISSIVDLTGHRGGLAWGH